MREFEVFDGIIAGVTEYSGATAMFQSDPRREGWLRTEIPFITFNVISEVPDPHQSGELRYQEWRKVNVADPDDPYGYKVETIYRHQPHILLSLTVYGGFKEIEKTAEYVARKVRDWFLGAGKETLTKLKCRTYSVSNIRQIVDVVYNTENDALSVRQMDVELVVPEVILNQIPSIEKVVLSPSVKETGGGEEMVMDQRSVLTDDYIEPSG